MYKEYREGGERWEREREKLVEGKREMATLREQDQIRIQELAVSESGCVCVCGGEERIGEVLLGGGA